MADVINSESDYAEMQYQTSGRIYQKLIDYSALQGRVLELGCGTGGFTVSLAEKGVSVTGVDNSLYSPDCIHTANEFAKTKRVAANFIDMDAESLSFENESFDSVIMIDMLEHIANIEKVCAEVQRVLKPGGQLTMYWGSPYYGPFGGHLRRYSKLPWRHLFPFFNPSQFFIKRYDKKLHGALTPEVAMGVWNSLNRLTLRRFRNLLRCDPVLQNFELLAFDKMKFLVSGGIFERLLRGLLNVLNKYPLAEEISTQSVWIVLRKNGTTQT